MQNTMMISAGLLLVLFSNSLVHTSSISPFDVPAVKELFRCNGAICPPGQDCITVDGTARCADPCKHYSVLNDTWRANDHTEDLSDPHCDDEVAWEGWYRMYLGDTSIRMPERCQPIKMCGTHAPSFLVQPHPQVGDGVQKHTICATWENGCCKFHLNPIHVKACTGNYVVYKLVNPEDCRVCYCADVNTKVCATCAENEECVSDDKITYKCEKGAQKNVQEHADDGAALSPFDVPAVEELFRCGGEVCPPGQDCIDVNGTPGCADPCEHYSVLNDTWRANNHLEDLSDPHCDDEIAWKGWYRMYLGDTSVRMPERCQPIKMCGTHAPSFLVQPHPQVGDGVQKHTICATWENGCCKFHLNPIHVKACAGNYVVYKLVNPQDCRVCYCADVNTKVCATCANNEACVSDDKITYRCGSKDVQKSTDVSAPLSPFDVPAVKELFRCAGSICPPGQDCITVDGTPRCADPCKHYSVLNDTWRANDHFEDLSDPHCDDDIAWEGWYRMYLGDTSIRMPERCQPIKMCGTHAPSFLVQPHPQVGDGVQKHTICATWENGCCKFHLNPIHVKACVGNYVVYKLVNPQDCRVCYCADVNTKVCATCGENQDCVSDDKISYRCENRAQKNVQEHADDGAALSPFDVPAVKELFRCNGAVCPPGKDCITINGVASCADPCAHYSVLNDTWRANDHVEDLSDPHCDDEIAWQGWYRMYLGDTSIRMPERCQPIKMCGTHAPSFLVQPHPQVGDGVQKHTICATWENGCCKFHLNPIHVKACVGNYVVYKLVNPQDCRVCYCADVNTKVCATCAENESCVSDDKITYRCEKRRTIVKRAAEAHPSSCTCGNCGSEAKPQISVTGPSLQEPQADQAPELECGDSFMELALSLAQLKTDGLDAASAQLGEAGCATTESRDGKLFVRVERSDGTCGNILKLNSTHLTYSNVLVVGTLSLPFSCFYSVEEITTLDVNVHPFLIGASLAGFGSIPHPTMALYKSEDFTETFPEGPIKLPTGATLHVGVTVEDIEDQLFATVMDNCYATHTPDPEDPERISLIENKCPADRSLVLGSVSGSSLQAHFSALLEEQGEVFLHCNTILCDKRRGSCIPNCSGRRRRAAAEGFALKPLTIGPIIFE